MSLLKEGKGMIEAGTGQASFQLDIMKKKLKIYGLQKKTEVEMTKLGEIVYNLFHKKAKDIRKEKQIIDLVNSIKEQQDEIKITEKEIEGTQGDLLGAKEKMINTGRDFFDKIKKGFSHDDLDEHGTEKENIETKPLEQNRSVADKESKQAKKTTENNKQKKKRVNPS